MLIAAHTRDPRVAIVTLVHRATYARRTPTRVNTGESGKGFNDIFTEHSVEAKRLSIITNALTSANTDADKTINAEEFIKAMVMLQNGLEKLGWPTGKHCTQCTLW
jgi:hypothetical protein